MNIGISMVSPFGKIGALNRHQRHQTQYGRVARIIARIVRDRARADHLAVEVFPKPARPVAQDLADAGGRW
ncbi:MAG: hypothetical protein AUF67_01960 [Acidobacteria bacterium 13_1_20CM_58_21]|nr:MAG: hypothetical protein AUF67_01960 [Acidobacteria bacterium 13_1_20CM_58_21]